MIWHELKTLFETESNLLYPLGLLTFPFSYFIARRLLRLFLSPRVFSSFSLTLSMRLVGSLQALAACASGVVIVHLCGDDIMKARCCLANSFAKFCTFYFFADLAMMYISFLELRAAGTFDKKPFSSTKPWTTESFKEFFSLNKLMTFHHLALPLIFGPCVILRRGVGDFFVGAFYFLEASTPFVNIRAVLRLFELHKTRVYVVNGVFMIIAFFLCRVAVFPFLYFSYARYASIPFWRVPAAIPIKCNASCLLLVTMQIYWFCLMIKATVRILTRKSED